jgi:hypothetical protein
MKVWVLFESYCGDPWELIGIYDSKDKATRYESFVDVELYKTYIEEWEVK